MAAYYLFSRTVTYTRPNDTTAYAIGDVVTETVPVPYVVFLPNLRRTESAFLTRIFMTTNRAAHVEALRMYLFSTAQTVTADNGAYALTVEPMGYVDFTTFVTAGAGSTIASCEGLLSALPMQVELGAGSIWGVLEARAIFTPSANQTFNCEFSFEVPNA